MFDKILTRVENTIIVACFLAITVLTFVNVVSRYAVHASLSWSAEVVVGCAVYLIMVGSSAAIRAGAHPDFSVLRDALRGWARRLVIVVIGLAIVAFLVGLMWIGLDQVTKQAARGRVTPALGTPQWLLTFAIPLGAFLGILRAIQMTVRQWGTPAASAAAVHPVGA
ncbi:TRAP transporter small permease [Galactobacter valiniphilus]|uniref:TRAP transporter small permease n=1 Tax=Galactobacter valiniphilus TaxID=2676122 RepID=UPI0037356EEF